MSLLSAKLVPGTTSAPLLLSGADDEQRLFNLPVAWMAVVVFVGTYLLATLVHLVVTKLAVDERARAFKALSPGMLPPLGIIFGLLVGFIAAQVGSDFERAKVAVATGASALRSVNLLAASLPAEQQARLRSLVAQHVDDAVGHEWPAMAQ
jgi:uncharacterized membrane protein HdeD (DUF308 family)